MSESLLPGDFYLYAPAGAKGLFGSLSRSFSGKSNEKTIDERISVLLR